MRYGTPCAWRPGGFLASMVTRAVRSHECSRYCRPSGRPYSLQRGIPSPRGGVTPRSRRDLHGVYRNIDRFAIALPSRVPLSPRLTLSRLALLRKPWAFGGGFPNPLVVTHAYIFFSSRSTGPRGSGFDADFNAPLPPMQTHRSVASAAILMPAHHPRVNARLVSCYALFE